MPDDVALVGDLTLDLDALAVRLVRVAAPFAVVQRKVTPLTRP